MANTTNSPLRLNEAQMTLLELFRHRQMSSDELNSLKSTLVRHLTDELDQEIEQVLKDKNQTPEDIAKRTEAMNENRTEFRRKNR
jgi:hypothetical protein